MAAAGKKVPALDNRPDPIGYGWLWEAFKQLSTCRSVGMAIGRIPWTAVQTWSLAHELDTEENWILHEVIHHMDDVFLEYHHKKQK